MILGLDPDNGSHFDVLIAVPVMFVAFIGYWRWRRIQKRKRMALYAMRRYEFSEFVREVTPAWRQQFGHIAPGEVYDQGPWGSSVMAATAHHRLILEGADTDEIPAAQALYERARVEDEFDAQPPELTRAGNPELYEAITRAYDPNDTDEFELPDMRGRPERDG